MPASNNRVMARFGGIMKIIEKFLRRESQGVLSGASHHNNSSKSSILMPVSSTGSLSVPGGSAGLKTVKDMPGPGGLCSLPYIGSLFLLWPFTNFTPEKSNLLFEELHRKSGRIIKFRKGSQWSVFLFDPQLIEEAMMYEGKFPNRPSPSLADVYSSRTGRPKGISQMQGEDWLKMRRPVQEFMMQPSNISQYIPALDEVAHDMTLTISRLRQEDGRIPLDNVMLRYAIESSSLYCINARLGFLQELTNNQSAASTLNKNSHVAEVRKDHSQNPSLQFRQLTDLERSQLMYHIKVYMKCVGSAYYTFSLYKFYRTKLYKEFEQASNFLSTVVQTRVSEMATLMTKNGHGSHSEAERPNLLKFLISDGRLDLGTCTTMLTGFLSTATDNISNSLDILLWYLAKNPSKQNSLREEINRCVPSRAQVPKDALSYMPYLKACLKESHRMTFPTPSGSVRIMPENITLDGYHIPAGTSVHFGHNVLGHSSKYFEDPEKYIPERWLKEAETDSLLRRQRSIITMPFGFGPRNCVGRRLAELQIYLAVIKILQQYKLSLGDPAEELDVVYKITASPSKPLDIRFHPL